MQELCAFSKPKSNLKCNKLDEICWFSVNFWFHSTFTENSLHDFYILIYKCILKFYKEFEIFFFELRSDLLSFKIIICNFELRFNMSSAFTGFSFLIIFASYPKNTFKNYKWNQKFFFPLIRLNLLTFVCNFGIKFDKLVYDITFMESKMFKNAKKKKKNRPEKKST